MATSDSLRCFLNGCNQRVMPNFVYCSLLHSNDAVKRGEAEACVYCNQFAKTPGFPTCSKTCGTLLASKRRLDANKTSYTPRSTTGSYPSVSATAGPKASTKDSDSQRSFKYPCGCTITTHVAKAPPICPICRSSGSGRPQPGGWRPSAQNSAFHRDADPFQDQADAALALVDPKRRTAGGFRPPVRTQGISDKKDYMPGSIDPLDGSDEDGYATPSEIALPESPVVETTSGSDSAVVVNYAGASRSDTMRSAPPPYDDTDWTKVEVPSGRSSPAKDQTLRSPVSQKKLPEIPPRRKGLFGRTLTSSKTPASSGNPSQEVVDSSSARGTSEVESPAVNPGPLGRPQNSKHSALAPSAQLEVPSFPVFPSAPTNALGISENPDGAGQPLVIADPKAEGAPEAFSNQDPLPITYNKKTYPSGEHLYHAMKFMDTRPLLAEHIRECTDPKVEASRFFYERNPGWDQMRGQKMEEVIQLKCKQHSSFKDRLRETGDTPILFNDPDPFWGTGPDGRGENQFGQVLMRVRATLGKGRLTRSLGLK